MTLTYRDLKDGEIRLITIITDRSDPLYRTGMVCCKLENFSLSENQRSDASKDGGRVKGWSWIWDRDSGDLEHEENLLLRENLKRKAQGSGRVNTLNTLPDPGTSTPTANVFDEDPDNALPWRYTWGDYVALSYLWGPVDPSKNVTVLINGEEFAVRSNLAAAMRQLEDCPRIKQGFKLWIDMICINQEDIPERETQVRKMKDIYASAWHVVVWLGVEADGSDLAMSTLRYLSRRHRQAPSSKHTDIICPPGWRVATSVRYTAFKRDVHVHLYRLLTRDYWYRLWILQEIALGRNDMPVLCGSSHINWSDVVAATTLIQQNELGFWMATDWALFFDRKGLSKGEYGYLDWQKADITRGSVRNRSWCRPEWRKFAELAKLQEDQSQFIVRQRLNTGNIRETPETDPHTEGNYQFQEQPSHEDHKFWKALLLGRSAAATDSRDKIYGILGLSGLSTLGLRINYKCSLEEVFVSFARCLITKSKSLNILRFANNPIGEILRPAGDSQTLTKRYLERETILSACVHTDLPSWAPCWVCDSGVSWETKGYNAGTLLPFSPTFETKVTRSGKEREILCLSGAVFDHIENLSAFHAGEVDETFPYNSSSISVASKSPAASSNPTVMNTPYPSISEALWRTLVGNRSSSGCTPAPDTYSCILSIRAAEAWQDEFLSSDVAYWLGKTLAQFRSRNKELDIFGTRLGDLLRSPSLISNIRSDAKKWADAASCARKTLEYRRLATTRKGYLGVVPAGARSGDVVAVLGGSEMVVILRPVDEDMQSQMYEVVGLAYIHGLMDGEIMGLVSVGKVKVHDIKLC